MEISRQEYEGPSRLDFRRNSRFTNSEPPVNYNPWNKRFSPIDSEFQSEMPTHSYRSHRGLHPYQRKQHPVQRPQASTSDPNNIPSLLTMEIPPQPLIPPEEVENLRAGLRNSIHGLQHDEFDESYDEPLYEEPSYDEPLYGEPPYDEPYDESPSAAVEEPLTEEEYLREEQKTKQQIEEIIAVAQALREKLDREEELRRQSEPAIPKLMDLKPKIPSLLEIYVPPPDTIEEICWNCNRTGHIFTKCYMRQQKKFCYSCGEPGYDVGSCPICYNNR